jgi:hypothetical protein
MKEKILTFLKSKLSGLSNVYLEGVAEFYSKTITDEKTIETTLTDGVIDLLKFNADHIQKEGDKRATEASKTAVQTYETKHNLKDGKIIGAEPPKTEPPAQPGDTQTAKQILELTNKVNSFEAEKLKAKLLADLHKRLTEKKIPIEFAKGVKLEKAEDLDAAFTEVETSFNAVKQELINNNVLIESPVVAQGTSSAESIKQEIVKNANWDTKKSSNAEKK